MLESIPGNVTTTFILTTLLTVGFLYFAVRRSYSHSSLANKITLSLIIWMAIQAMLALNLFYTDTSLPPKLFLFGALPAFVLMIILFNTKKGKAFIDDLPLSTLQ